MFEITSLVASNEVVPIFVSVEVGGAICERGRQCAYLDARRGDLPVERFGNRLLVSVARLALRAGRPITAADIARAEEIVRSRKCSTRAVA